MKKRFNTLVFTLAACYCLSVLPMLLTGCANASGGGGSSGKEKKDDKKDGNKTDDNSTLPFTSTSLKRTGRTEIINDNEIEILQFGDWPQSEKDSSVTIDKSQKTINGGNTYYKGSDGAWYVEMSAAFYNPTDPGQASKFFKVEPIEWYVLTKNYSGKTLLLSKTVLKRMVYHDNTFKRYIDGQNVESSYYKYSTIRAFLNGIKYERKTDAIETQFEDKGFFQTAFDSEDQALIETTTLDNTCDDKVFILSPEEAKSTALGFQEYVYDTNTGNPSYGDPLINHTESAYSRFSDGLNTNLNSLYLDWWLRDSVGKGTQSPMAGKYHYDDHGNGISTWVNGTVYREAAVTNQVGVVPALCISTSTYENLPDVQPHTTTYIWKSALKFLPAYTDGTLGTSYPYVTFGVYPQSEKADNVTIAEDAETQKHGSMTFIKGSDGCWYVKGGQKYFKVEPIKWCILTRDYKGTGKKLLLAENILVNCNYYEGYLLKDIPEALRSNKNTEAPAYPNSYWDSTLRAYLNGDDYYVRNDSESINVDKQITKYKNQGFMYAAFNEVDIKGIVSYYADKIFTLSLNELTEYINSNDHRKRSVTDFAKNNGTYADGDYGKWWTRTVLQVPKNDGSNTTNNTDYVLIVTPDGVVKNTDDTIPEDNVAPAANWNQVTSNGYKFVGTDIGVVPALIVD